jgi:hypothetical protein
LELSKVVGTAQAYLYAANERERMLELDAV